MNKYFLLAAFAFSASMMSARELKFYNGTTPIGEGERVNFSKVTVEPIGNESVEINFKPEIYLGSDIFTNSVSLTAKCLTGQTIQFCPGGDCETGVDVTKEGITLRANQKIDILYEYLDVVSASAPIPVVVTELSAYDTKYPEVKASCTIVLDTEAAIYSILADEDSFRVVEGGIEYNFEQTVNVSLFMLSGEKVFEKELCGTGLLSTSDFDSGIYLYNAGEKSGKLFIR